MTCCTLSDVPRVSSDDLISLLVSAHRLHADHKNGTHTTQYNSFFFFQMTYSMVHNCLTSLENFWVDIFGISGVFHCNLEQSKLFRLVKYVQEQLE